MIYYAGIGSRETPEDVCRKMFKAGKSMAKLENFILRSGGAPGADTAFESGCLEGIIESDATDVSLHSHELYEDPRIEIYLPWKGFNSNKSPLYGASFTARRMASQYHPNWQVLGDRGRDFMGRNCYQILGPELNVPVSFILCWTPNGEVTGGTGQALRMAQDFNIPILNFAVADDEYISDFIYQIAKDNP